KTALAEGAFDTLRREPQNVFSVPGFEQASILIAGRNFGCGSSREHAVWAIQALGFRAVIAVSFAEIFRDNALKNGLLPIALDAAAVEQLMDQAASGLFKVDLEHCRLSLASGKSFDFAIDPFRRKALLHGLDDIEISLSFEAAIDRWERAAFPNQVLHP
ncbi:MAG: 3-isopropylmalate dehydratase small subunit, partial [Allosphingosinicella sp.]